MEPVNVRYAGSNGLLVNASLLLSLTRNGLLLPARYTTLADFFDSFRGANEPLRYCLLTERPIY